MNNKLRRSESKISGLFYVSIPALYWNDEGNQINFQWGSYSSAISPNYWVISLQRFEARYWATAFRRQDLEFASKFREQITQRHGDIPRKKVIFFFHIAASTWKLARTLYLGRLVFPPRNWTQNFDSNTSKKESQPLRNHVYFYCYGVSDLITLLLKPCFKWT